MQVGMLRSAEVVTGPGFREADRSKIDCDGGWVHSDHLPVALEMEVEGQQPARL